MARKPIDRTKLIAGIITAIICIFLLNMGFWQLQRLQWKNGLIAKLQAEQQIDPKKVSLAAIAERPDAAMRRGFLSGVWVLDKNMRVGPHMVDGQLGYWIVSPLVLNDGTRVLVNRGWVPEKMIVVAMDSMPPKGIVTITGMLRESDHGAGFVGDDTRSWHELDVNGMAANNGITNVSPLTFFMEGSEPADLADLKPAPVISSLRNEHLNYAIFWFGMAILVVVIFYMAVLQPKKTED